MDAKDIQEKYARTPYPVMVANSDGIIVFVNDATKKNFNVLKKKLNIAFLCDSSELEKLKEIKKTGKADSVEITLSPRQRIGALVIPEKIDGAEYITLLFVSPFNLIGSKSGYEMEIGRILDVYNREKSLLLNNALFDAKEADGEIKGIFQNYKKIAKVDKYINLCLKNLSGRGRSEAKQMRDIADDLLVLKDSLNSSIVALGYRIRYMFDEKWFYVEYNQWDFLVVNAIAVSFALRNSTDRRIDYIFNTEGGGAAEIEIIFQPQEVIYEYFNKSLSMDITEAQNASDINYFDLYLAYTVAANNNMLFKLSTKDNKLKFVIEIKKADTFTHDTGTPLKSGDYVWAREKLGKMLVEFILPDFLGDDEGE